MKKDWCIELFRFFATCGIAIFHFEWIYLGHPVYFKHFYLFVEFFFVLSGFFLVKNATSNLEKARIETIEYVKKTALKLWKPYLLAFAFSFVVYCLVNNIKDIGNVLRTLFAAKWEIFMLQLSGFDLSAPNINGVTAYIPALLFSSLVIHFCVKKSYGLLTSIIIPVVPIFVYAHIINTYGNLSQWQAWENWYTVGIIRGLAGMLIGAGAYIYGMQATKTYVPWGGGVVLAGTIFFSLVYYRDYISYADEIMYPYLFGVTVVLMYFRNASKINQVIERICLELGKISYCIFLFHYGICFLFEKYCGEKEYGRIAPIYILLVIMVGFLSDRFVRFIERFVRKRSA